MRIVISEVAMTGISYSPLTRRLEVWSSGCMHDMDVPARSRGSFVPSMEVPHWQRVPQHALEEAMDDRRGAQSLLMALKHTVSSMSPTPEGGVDRLGSCELCHYICSYRAGFYFSYHSAPGRAK